MGSRVVAIHQPNFFPWLGYFDKLARADIFVVLDNVQFPKTGGTWMNRVRLSIGGNPEWISMPVVRAYHGLRLVSEMKINNGIPWRKKLLRTIVQTYGGAPYFHAVFPVLSDLIENPTDRLLEFNLKAIHALAEAVGLVRAKVILGSALSVRGQSTDLLVEIVQRVDGTTYLCGGGAQGYQESDKFGKSGIDLIYQDFQHPKYPQAPGLKFCQGLSIIDAIMYCGFDGVRQLLTFPGAKTEGCSTSVFHLG